MKTVLTNCTVIDCTGRPPMKETTVIIEDDKIVELKPGRYQQIAEETDVRVFDLEGGYVLPGLWDCHAHLGELFVDIRHLVITESAVEYALRAGRNAMDALRAGIVGLRVTGGRDFIDVSWKRAFDSGVFVGPHLFVCGPAIGPKRVDGPHEMRKLVRETVKHGVDWIKLIIDEKVPLLLDEVKAATEVAHAKGVRVCAHVRGAHVKSAIQGGVDCIEHGGSLDEEAIEMLLENDLFYVPTLNTAEETAMRESGTGVFQNKDVVEASHALKGRLLISKGGMGGIGMPGQRKAQVEPLFDYSARVKDKREAFQKALKAGAKIACGSDTNPIAEYVFVEMEYMVSLGMTEMEALIAATRTSADLCGVLDRLGTVEVGKLADLVVVSGNPLENISNLRKLKLVLKGGKLVETRESEGLADFWELYFLGEGFDIALDVHMRDRHF